MNTLILPDIHGRMFWAKPCHHPEEYNKIIFLGDYLDPYPWENIMLEDCLTNFLNIIQLKKNNPDKVILLLGNHDCHYISPNIIEGSRYSRSYAKTYHELFIDNIKLFQLVYWLDDILFSHAGFNRSWMEDWDITNPLELNSKPIGDLGDELSCVSHYRGGMSNGSCIWSDIREMGPKNLPNFKYQIFGHTQMEHEIITDKWACLDCRRAFVLKDDGLHYWNSEDTPYHISLDELFNVGSNNSNSQQN